MITIRVDTIKRYRTFFVATEAIYLSGTLMVLIACAVLKGLPLSFALISEILILFIFTMTTFSLFFVARKTEKMIQKADENKDRQD